MMLGMANVLKYDNKLLYILDGTNIAMLFFYYCHISR